MSAAVWRRYNAWRNQSNRTEKRQPCPMTRLVTASPALADVAVTSFNRTD
jgi:hypothetical protein